MLSVIKFGYKVTKIIPYRLQYDCEKKQNNEKQSRRIKTVPLQRPKKNVLLKSETGTRGRDGLPCPLSLVLKYYVNPIYD